MDPGSEEAIRYSRMSWSILAFAASFSVNGLDQLTKLDQAPICIANHMSLLDILILPAFLSPYWKVSFVIKRSLLRYPFFGPVLRSTLPIEVSRIRARDDFVQVMDKGSKYLESGRAVVIFQQYSRATDFVKTQFSSLGIKLARRTGAPVLPIALKTDVLQNGRFLKDLGHLSLDKKVMIDFGQVFYVKAYGKREQKEVIDFICKRLNEWKFNA